MTQVTMAMAARSLARSPLETNRVLARSSRRFWSSGALCLRLCVLLAIHVIGKTLANTYGQWTVTGANRSTEMFLGG